MSPRSAVLPPRSEMSLVHSVNIPYDAAGPNTLGYSNSVILLLNLKNNQDGGCLGRPKGVHNKTSARREQFIAHQIENGLKLSAVKEFKRNPALARSSPMWPMILTRRCVGYPHPAAALESGAGGAGGNVTVIPTGIASTDTLTAGNGGAGGNGGHAIELLKRRQDGPDN